MTADQRTTVVAWRDYWLAPSETFIRDQVNCLTRWHAVWVGRRHYDDPLVTPLFAPHSDAVAARVASRLPASRQTRLRYDQIIGDPAVQIVHAHFGPDGLSALPYARRAGKPLIVSFYGMDVTSLPQRRGPSAGRYRRRLPELFAHAQRLIAPSEYLAEQLELLGAPTAKITINSPGTVVPPRPGLRTDRSGVIFVGRLVQKKGVADLLEAMALLPEPLRSTRVTIAGYGPLLPGLQRTAARLGLDTEFVGRQSSTAIAALLNEHAVFCGPSQRAPNGDAESLGMVFVEAALAGLPVVAYRHGGVPEAVGDRINGLLSPEGDVALLSWNLGSLLADPARASALGAAGYPRAARLFDLDRQNAGLERIYDEVVETARDRRHRSNPTVNTPQVREGT